MRRGEEGGGGRGWEEGEREERWMWMRNKRQRLFVVDRRDQKHLYA